MTVAYASLLLGVVATLAVVPLYADEAAGETIDHNRPGLWGIRLVAFAQDFPAYPASSDNNLTVLPLPYPVYRGKNLRFGENLEELADGRIVSGERIKLSIGISASFPEDSDKLSGRNGMPDLDFLVEAGPELQFALWGDEAEARELTLSVQARGAVSLDGLRASGRGFVISPEFEFVERGLLGPKNELRLRVAPAWASRNYQDYFYGVAAEYTTPNRPRFDASSGYLNTEFLFGINRRISDRLEFRGSARLWVNKGAANDISPLYQRDYDRGVRLALFWTAWESKRRARSRPGAAKTRSESSMLKVAEEMR